ncbi:unnamed protein product [Enterobius vermicularis]|uniref:AAA_11 domain-containing protein n=1 Tax=Enterobius vermicularis TaxID=51028 RepID=A0A0N4V420_ENTVE|nr:unnamed protein product [Enterobius vermicularis]
MYELKYLITDEAGLLPEMNLVIMIANLPGIKKVLVMGDQKQLPPYTAYLTDNVIQLGHESIIQELMENRLVSYVCLTVNFRSHPYLVHALAEASYGGNLTPA